MITFGQADFDILAGLMPIMDALERIGARAALTGGLAAVAHGVGRTVSDVDIVADLTPAQLRDLVAHLWPRYAVDQRMGETALAARTSFPLVELSMLLKVDIVLPRERALDRAALDRARPTQVAFDLPPLPLIAPEDLILFKLERAARIWPLRDSDWYDLEFLLKFRHDLDHAYLDAQATALGWTKGLTTARTAAQTEPLALDVTLVFERTMLDAAWNQQCPPYLHVEGARRDRMQGVAFERRRDRAHDPTVDDLALALTAFKWRYWDCQDPAASERLVTLVAARVDREATDVPQR